MKQNSKVVEEEKKEVVEKGTAEEALDKAEPGDDSPFEMEQPRKRIRTRSMDMAEEESLYAMRRYRISPETIGILASKGITELFPIQALSFDSIFDGKDLIGRAPTGQGKTLAFALPIVEKIYKLGLTPPRRSRAPLCLVLSPTRELAQQIDEQIRMVAPRLRSVCLYGCSGPFTLVLEALLSSRRSPRFAVASSSSLGHLAAFSTIWSVGISN